MLDIVGKIFMTPFVLIPLIIPAAIVYFLWRSMRSLESIEHILSNIIDNKTSIGED